MARPAALPGRCEEVEGLHRLFPVRFYWKQMLTWFF